MKASTLLACEIRGFIADRFLFGGDLTLGDDDSLPEAGFARFVTKRTG